MRLHLVALLGIVGLLYLAVLVGISDLYKVKPAWAGLQGPSGTLAACASFDPSGANAELVATGTVEEMTVRSDSSVASIRIDRIFKGESGETVEVLTGAGSRSGSSVDVALAEGNRYLLYLDRQGGVWTTNICFGTRQIGDTLPPELVAALGVGVDPRDPLTLPETGGPDVSLLVALVGLAVLGAGKVLSQRER